MKFLRIFFASLLAVIVGSILSFFIWVALISGMASSLQNEAPTVVGDSSVLVINMNESITDTPDANPLNSFNVATMSSTKNIALIEVLRAIEAAAQDVRIKGIEIHLTGEGTATLSTLEELRVALVEFKASKKFIIAYNDIYSQASYYLASVADKIYIQPEGDMSWIGMGSTLMFYKGALDKLGVKAEIFRPTACKYKSAVEPFFRTEMSKENREQTEAFINDLWNEIVTTVSQSRGIAEKDLQRMASNFEIMTSDDALKAKLVDAVIYEDELKQIYKDLGVDENYTSISLGEYVKQIVPTEVQKDTIGIIYAEGEIFYGENDAQDIYSKTLCEKINKAREDKNIKAVVLRVNSPGGSALASDLIWREIERLKQEKPVIVSMGQYAASGGYYISCGTDAILCDKTTITGSIGVFGLMLEGGQLIEQKFGITTDVVKTNDSSDFGNGIFGLNIRGLKPTERAAFIRSVDKVYATFTGKVAKGRNLDINKVLDIAGGRVWSGTDALEIGLVDGIGGLKQAIAIAADKANLKDFSTVTVEGEQSPMKMLMKMLNAKISAVLPRNNDAISTAAREYDAALKQMTRTGIQAYCPYRISF
ncbi:MAG: signal peptide peptidase SppA [Alistipes sp.]|nr:signal peptide peptidase SppA [Candidatus Alistipes equi]